MMNRDDFQRAIQHAEDATGAESANINLTAAHAKFVVDHFFKDGVEEISYSAFLAEVTRLSVEAGTRGRGGQVGAGQLGTF